MSSGKVHTLSAAVMAAEYTLASVITLDPSNIEYALGALFGIVVHPDLDVNHASVYSYKLIRTRLGALPYFGWYVVWFVYRKSLKHGSGLSHFPVVGTVGRLVYLFMCVIVIPYIVLAPVLHLDFWGEVTWWAWALITKYKFVLGLMSIDFIHWILDIFTTEHRKEKRHGAGTVRTVRPYPGPGQEVRGNGERDNESI